LGTAWNRWKESSRLGKQKPAPGRVSANGSAESNRRHSLVDDHVITVEQPVTNRQDAIEYTGKKEKENHT
jgi:hypothetical protein